MAAPHNKGNGKGIAFLRSLVGHHGDECVPWPFSKNHKGYGLLGVDGKTCKANRIMCELEHGPPPTPKHQATHSCGNGHEGCVNPLHLEWKTNRDNQLDRFDHGTMPKPGKKRRLLSPEQIAEIRSLKGKVPQYDLAKQFGVKPGTIEYWQGHSKPPSILTDEKVRAIRTMGGLKPTSEIAAEFGISKSSVQRVLAGETWAHIR